MTQSTVAADEDEATRRPGLDRFRCLDDLGHIGQVVAAQAHRVRSPLVDQPPQSTRPLHLEINDAHVMSDRARRAGDQFESKRLQGQENPCIHQPARVNSK